MIIVMFLCIIYAKLMTSAYIYRIALIQTYARLVYIQQTRHDSCSHYNVG